MTIMTAKEMADLTIESANMSVMYDDIQGRLKREARDGQFTAMIEFPEYNTLVNNALREFERAGYKITPILPDGADEEADATLFEFSWKPKES